MRRTEKLYYSHPYAQKIKAHIVRVYPDTRRIELDRTIAYPEGGGQECDHCSIVHLKTGKVFASDDVKKMYGREVKVGDDHYVTVEGIILHGICSQNTTSLDGLEEGDEVSIEIDTLLREKLTTSHSAAHLVYVAIGQIRNDVIPGIIGCHIKDGQARFDFRTPRRFSEEDIAHIEAMANAFVDANHAMRVFPSQVHHDARFWECETHRIPCGGTHLTATGTIGPLTVKRKNIGQGKERVICKLDNPVYHTERYEEALTL